MTLRSLPISRLTDAAVATTGTAFAIPDGSLVPFFPATQAKIYVSAQAFVGFGPTSTPPVAAVTNTVYQEATTEEVYVLTFPHDELIDHLFVYAATGTIAVRVSFFG